MPIYEYECRVCHQRFEKLQSINDEPIRVCPNCGGETRRVLQPVGVIFKGSGWYVTDSRKNTSSPAAATGDKAAKSESGGSSETTPSSDSAPAKADPPAAPTSGGED
jgi:putative FmdB family regulatory protein